MAGRKLAATVHVGGQVFEAGSTPPKEFADLITNPKAWGAEVDADGTDAGEPAPKRRAPRKAAAKKTAAKEQEPKDEPKDDESKGEDDADLLS